MKLFSRNAEQLIKEKMDLMQNSHDSWRCIYINLSDSRADLDRSMKTMVVVGIIKDLLGPIEGSIYICNDGDVFIIFQGQVSPILNHLGGHLSNFNMGSDSAHSRDDQYTVFDLSKHWDAFCEKCNSKLLVKKEKAVFEEVVKEINPLPELNVAKFKSACSKKNGRKKLLVMVVEDDPFTRRLVNGTLKQEFDVIEAGSGLSAIESYENMAPDAVFLDIELPDVNGHILLSKFLSLDKTAFIVMLSANSVKENILAALQKGAQGFVAKPFAKDITKTVVSALPIENAKILMVEDHPINQMLLQKLLLKLGVKHIDKAENGIEALKAISKESYSLILMDCQMPELDGYETTKYIRESEVTSHEHLPIVAMTANAMVGDREKCLKAGMDDYLSKPVDLASLTKTLGRWLSVVEMKQINDQVKLEGASDLDISIDVEHLRNFTDGDANEESILFKLFLERADATVATLEYCSGDAYFDEWRKAAHLLKGASGNLGAKPLFKLCNEAEVNYQGTENIKRKQLQNIRDELNKVRHFINTLQGGKYDYNTMRG